MNARRTHLGGRLDACFIGGGTPGRDLVVAEDGLQTLHQSTLWEAVYSGQETLHVLDLGGHRPDGSVLEDVHPGWQGANDR